MLAVRKLFPDAWLHDFQFSIVEDIVNAAPFRSLPPLAAGQGAGLDGSLWPHLRTCCCAPGAAYFRAPTSGNKREE